MNYLLDSRNSATYPSFEQRWLVVVFALALVIRVAYAFLAPLYDPFLVQDELWGDARDFDELAWNLLEGNGFTQSETYLPSSFRPPLYPVLLAALHGIFGPGLVAPRLVQALLGALVVPVGYLIAKRLFGGGVARLTGIGIALHPILIYFGAWIISDTLFVLLFTSTILFAVITAERASILPAVLTGVSLGLSVLTRPQGVLLLPLILVWSAWNLKGSAKPKWILYPTFILLSTLAVLMPWTIRNYGVHKELVFVSTNGGFTFYGANNPDAFGGHVPGYPPPIEGLSEVERDREYYRLGLQWIRQAPEDFISLLPKKFIRLWSPIQVNIEQKGFSLPGAAIIQGVYALYLLLATYGATRIGPNWKSASIVLYPILCVVIPGLVYYGGTRYALPLAPFLVVLTAVGLARNRLTRYLLEITLPRVGYHVLDEGQH